MEMHHHEGNFWGAWQFAPEIVIPLGILAFLFTRSAKRTGQKNIFFIGGIFSALSVIVTPIGVRAMDSFTLHMTQHIVLMMITGPLLVMATPNTFNPSNRIFNALTNPIFSWISYAALMIGVHLPGPHNFVMENSWAHDYLEVPLYLILPYFFYFNLLDRKLERQRISPALSVISLFLMMVPETLTGFFIYVSPGTLYNNTYEINDQRLGGSLMWSGAMIIDAVWIALAVYHWLKSEEKKSQEIDAQVLAERKNRLG